MSTTPTSFTAACDALLLRLLELEETDDPARGRSLTDIGRGLPDPLGEWVGEHAVRIRTRWRHQGWIIEPGGASLVHNDAFVELTGAGRAHGERVREQRRGVHRDRAVRERLLLFLHTREQEGQSPVAFVDLEEAASPWAWLADQPLDWAGDIERAAEYLNRQGLLAHVSRTEEAGILYAQLSDRGVQVVEDLVVGSAPGSSPGAAPQVVNNHYGPVSGTLVQGRDVHGDLSDGRGPGRR